MALLRDRSLEFDKAGVHLFAVSTDSPYSHLAWAEVLDVAFPLLSDWNRETIRGFGVEQVYRGLEGVAQRSAFLVDVEGVVRGAWRYADAEVPDVDELLAAARALAD